MVSKGIYLVFISMLVFSILNFIENLIHYNIGRSHSNDGFSFYIPNYVDLKKIIFIMILFGLLQGLFTEFFIYD